MRFIQQVFLSTCYMSVLFYECPAPVAQILIHEFLSTPGSISSQTTLKLLYSGVYGAKQLLPLSFPTH